MFNDFYLKFDDEVAAQAVLYTTTPAVVVDDVEVTPEEVKPNYRNIDVLGTIYEKAPEPVPEDYEPVPLSGFHVNVRVIDGEDASVLEPYSVIPTNPRRIWWS